MHAQQQNDEHSGKYPTLILDSGANLSLLKPGLPVATHLTPATQVATLNGKFHTNRTANIQIRAPKQTINVKALVHERLPVNLLSVTPLVEKLGALILDKRGAAMLSTKQYRQLQPKLKYFGKRHNKPYHLPFQKGAMCLGAQEVDDNVSMSKPAAARSPDVNA